MQMEPSQQNIIDDTYSKAIEILEMNTTSIGFSASVEKVDNYFSVWARDHSICTLAACLTEDKRLISTAKKGILFLLRRQIDHGQVPSYIEIEGRKKDFGGFGLITSIDSNLWVVIAAAHLHRLTGDRRFISKSNMIRYKKFYRLFKAFDSNDCGLIEVPKAGDWADVFGRTYHVLYDECLYYQALKDLDYLFSKGIEMNPAMESDKYIRDNIKKRIRWIRKRRPRVKRRINELMWFTKDNIGRIRKEYYIIEGIREMDYDYYQSHLTPFKIDWEKRFDSFGNILAILTGIANRDKSERIIRHVKSNRINHPFPIKSLYPPVFRHEKDWEPIYRLKQQPYTYHNGGIWPVISGLWIHVLEKRGHHRLAEEELWRLADNIRRDQFLFHEYYHGKTGRPCGRVHQAWSAAGYIIAYHSVKDKIRIFS